MDETSKAGGGETKSDETAPAAAEVQAEVKAEEGAEAPKVTERVDEEGLPLDWAPTLDDVRGAEGSGRTIAIGCTVLVVLATLGFWLLRMTMMR